MTTSPGLASESPIATFNPEVDKHSAAVLGLQLCLRSTQHVQQKETLQCVIPHAIRSRYIKHLKTRSLFIFTAASVITPRCYANAS